jgi:hypothetical protein
MRFRRGLPSPVDAAWRLSLALLFALLLASQPAAAEGWSLVRSPGGSGQAASTQSAEGHRLYIWSKHLQDRSLVFAELHLENGDEFAGRMPIYRIDGGETVDTEMVRREGEKQGSLWGFVAGRACFWLIWSSNRQEVEPSDHLAAWITGRVLTIRYQAADGLQKEIAFGLEGDRSAIEQAAAVTFP